MSKKKRNEQIVRIGNFVITKNSAGYNYIRIKSSDGHWSITHREDSPMYGAWLMMLNNPEYEKGIEVRLVMEYTMSQMLYDEGFLADWWKAIGEFNQRRVEKAPTPDDKEEENAIAEIMLFEELKKGSENFNKD